MPTEQINRYKKRVTHLKAINKIAFASGVVMSGVGVLLYLDALTVAGAGVMLSAKIGQEFFVEQRKKDVIIQQKQWVQKQGFAADAAIIAEAQKAQELRTRVRVKMLGAFVGLGGGFMTLPFISGHTSDGVILKTVIVGIFLGWSAAHAIEKRAKKRIALYDTANTVADSVVEQNLKQNIIQRRKNSSTPPPLPLKMS